MNYRERYKHFYQQKEWRELRQQVFIEAKGLCEECLKKNIVTEGKEVHHKIPISSKKGWEMRLDRNNLICLCSDCHNSIHLRESPLQKFLKEWNKL